MLSAVRHTPAVLAAIAALSFAAGCGSSDSADKPKTISEAKAALSTHCQGGKAEDKALCDCIADKLEAAGNDAEQILALDKQVNAGKMPAEITKVAGECPAGGN